MRPFSSKAPRSIPMVAIAAAVVACSHAQPAPAPAPEATQVAQSAPPAAAEPEAKMTPVSIYFGLDSADLGADARAALTKFTSQVQSRSDLELRIEGNCDERGSREYNLALGQRRADAAKDYLVFLGIPASRITTLSNGKEKPRASGHHEQAWKKNRRDDLIPMMQAVGQASR
jgi:peptidoglycan-associated lipoprotein